MLRFRLPVSMINATTTSQQGGQNEALQGSAEAQDLTKVGGTDAESQGQHGREVIGCPRKLGSVVSNWLI